MQLIIDRFEGRFAICEKPDRTMLKLPKATVPPEAREGDVLQLEDDRVTLDLEATRARKKAATDKFRQLRQTETTK